MLEQPKTVNCEISRLRCEIIKNYDKNFKVIDAEMDAKLTEELKQKSRQN